MPPFMNQLVTGMMGGESVPARVVAAQQYLHYAKDIQSSPAYGMGLAGDTPRPSEGRDLSRAEEDVYNEALDVLKRYFTGVDKYEHEPVPKTVFRNPYQAESRGFAMPEPADKVLLFNYPDGDSQWRARQEEMAARVRGRIAVACPVSPAAIDAAENWAAVEEVNRDDVIITVTKKS